MEVFCFSCAIKRRLIPEKLFDSLCSTFTQTFVFLKEILFWFKLILKKEKKSGTLSNLEHSRGYLKHIDCKFVCQSDN